MVALGLCVVCLAKHSGSVLLCFLRLCCSPCPVTALVAVLYCAVCVSAGMCASALLHFASIVDDFQLA